MLFHFISFCDRFNARALKIYRLENQFISCPLCNQTRTPHTFTLSLTLFLSLSHSLFLSLSLSHTHTHTHTHTCFVVKSITTRPFLNKTEIAKIIFISHLFGDVRKTIYELYTLLTNGSAQNWAILNIGCCLKRTNINEKNDLPQSFFQHSCITRKD